MIKILTPYRLFNNVYIEGYARFFINDIHLKPLSFSPPKIPGYVYLTMYNDYTTHPQLGISYNSMNIHHTLQDAMHYLDVLLLSHGFKLLENEEDVNKYLSLL